MRLLVAQELAWERAMAPQCKSIFNFFCADFNGCFSDRFKLPSRDRGGKKTLLGREVPLWLFFLSNLYSSEFCSRINNVGGQRIFTSRVFKKLWTRYKMWDVFMSYFTFRRLWTKDCEYDNCAARKKHKTIFSMYFCLYFLDRLSTCSIYHHK